MQSDKALGNDCIGGCDDDVVVDDDDALLANLVLANC